MNFLSKIFVTFVVLFLFTMGAQAIPRINEVELSKDNLDYGEDFVIKAKLSGETCSFSAKFFIGDYNYATKNLLCEADEVEAKFDLKADNLEMHRIRCGKNIARVEILNPTGTATIANESVEFDLGYVPKITFTPTQPLPNKPLRIKLTDAKNDNPLVGVDVIIKDAYGGDPISSRTDTGGTVLFTPNIAGLYKIVMDERDVCGEQEFYIKRPLIIDGPRPENPVIDEMVLVAVPAGSSVGVKIYDANGEVYKTVASSYNGGANFTISDPGTYTIAFGDISTKYWSLNKTLTVSDRLLPSIEIAPDKPIVGKPVTIKVNSRDQPLADARVTIKKPDGVEIELMTNGFGAVTYDPISMSGIHEVRASKDRYAPSTNSFEAKNGFVTKIEPTQPTVNDEIVLTIHDQDDKPVADALVEIPKANYKKVTDMGGVLRLHIQQPEKYEIKISKDNFWDKVLELTPIGSLSFTECPSNFELGKEITINVINSFEQAMQAEIAVKDPKGIITQYDKESVTLSPTEPGIYTVTASKSNFKSTNMSFEVLPHVLDVSTWMSSGVLYLNVTYKGNPVESVLTVITTPDGDLLNQSTDSSGISEFSVAVEGNISAEINSDNGNAYYTRRDVKLSVVRSYDLILLTTPLVILSLITVFTIIIIQVGRKIIKMPISIDSDGKPKKSKKDHPSKAKHDSQLMSQSGGRSRLSDL